ncbi:MAG: agmatinase [Thermoproteota archaeon]|nr:agmatinase [Thermoproteota archaeon]
MHTVLKEIETLFVIPENTGARASFGDLDIGVTFEQSDVVVLGIPLEQTTSFGKGTSRGPEAIRTTSAHQIETFVFEEKVDIKNLLKILDIGDLLIPKKVKGSDNVQLVMSFLDQNLTNTIKQLGNYNKIPISLGGEHTLTYFCYKALSNHRPLLIHFDAHRDLKSEYKGQKLCHTTPFFRLIEEGYVRGSDIVQIGIRQADEVEDHFARDNGVVTFDAWEVNKNIDKVISSLSKLTKKRKIYISFDIDVYDIQYVPCTGTPEPFGLNPFDIIKIFKGIHESADLIGMDMVEVSLRNRDYREGTLATQTLLRILTRNFLHTRH